MSDHLILVGSSHKTSPLEQREALAIAGDDLATFTRRVASHRDVAEAFVLSTCNRV